MSRELEGWPEAEYITEIESLREQLCLLAGAAGATIAASCQNGGKVQITTGFIDALKACTALHELPAYKGIMAVIDREWQQ